MMMNWTRFTDFILRRRRSGHADGAEPTYFTTGTAGSARDKPVGRLPRFKGAANDPDQPVRGRDSRFDQMRAKLQRAFTPSQPVNDVRMFAGRKEQLVSLIRAIEDQHLHVVIFGERGIGKTSLLHVFSQLAREARYIVRYASCSEASEFDPVFRTVAAGIPLLYHSDFDPTSEAAERGAALDELLPDRTVGVPQITDAFSRLSGTRVLVVLDEFDRATSPDFKRSIAELIKNLSDQSIRVQIVIAGVAANLTELVDHIPSIRRNVLGIPITTMAREEIVELVELGETVSGIEFGQRAIDAITVTAQGSPYIAGLIAQQAATAALDRNSNTVELGDVTDATRRALTDAKVRVSPRGQRHLEKLEASGLGLAIAELANDALHNFGVVPATGATPPNRAQLVGLATDLGVLVPTTDIDQPGYRFADDGVALCVWLEAAAARDARPA